MNYTCAMLSLSRITHVKITLERAVRDARRNVGTPAHPSFRQPVIPRRRDRDRWRKRNCKGRRRLPERVYRGAYTRLYRATRLQRVIIYTAREARARHRDRPHSSSIVPISTRRVSSPTNLTEATGQTNGNITGPREWAIRYFRETLRRPRVTSC